MPTKRPVWVWIIAVSTFLAAGIALLSTFAATIVPVSEVEMDMPPLTLFDYVVAVVFALAEVVAAIYLLRLRKPAFYWYTVPFIAWILLSLWDAITKGAAAVIGQDVVGYTAFGVVIGLAICIYCWRLMQNGVLE